MVDTDHRGQEASGVKARPQFSVITPTWNRLDGRLERAILSVADQTWRDFEHIVVDDCSTDGTAEWLTQACDGWEWLQPLILEEHRGRVIARNEGMRAAMGAWICWLDSDDVYDPMYLETLAWYIEQEPEVDLWVVGAIVHGIMKGGGPEHYGGHTVPKWTKLRKPWIPKVDANGRHEIFNSGRVGTGMFVFRKSCLDVTGYLPSWRNHNHIADGMNDWLELEPGDHWYDRWSSKHRLVGNPFGDDHAMFCKLCRHFRAHRVGDGPCLYTHYIR